MTKNPQICPNTNQCFISGTNALLYNLIWRLTQSQLCGFLTVTSDLMQEQPTLEMVSAGSDTQETSSLNKSFNIRLIRDS